MKHSPKEFVEKLKDRVIGQSEAKRVLAVALRNRWRRSQLDTAIQKTITPKNILMIGPTGVGKTAIIRAMADLVDAPMIKVEATRYTQIGYVGDDVNSMVKDLVVEAKRKSKEKLEEYEKMKKEYNFSYDETIAFEFFEKLTKILHFFKYKPIKKFSDVYSEYEMDEFKRKVKNYDKRIEGVDNYEHLARITLSSGVCPEYISIKVPYSNEISKARDEFYKLVKEYEKFLDCDEKPYDFIDMSIKDYVENMGIIFIDEIDKLASINNVYSHDNIGRMGVQRDLLCLLDGTSISTSEGIINTENIVFIAAGAFHVNKVSDLMPELLGRLPIRVDLDPMDIDTMVEILTNTVNSPVKQYISLMKADKVNVTIDDDAYYEIAKIADQINNEFYSMGARTLHLVVERVFSEVSFISFNEPTSDKSVKTFNINADYVKKSAAIIFEKFNRYSKEN